MKITTDKLENGIRLVHQHTESTVAHFGVMLCVGMRDETKDEGGIAHFIEHMLFKGTTTRQVHQIFDTIEGVGGELNAYTTKENTAIFASLLAQDLPASVELLSDIICNSTFPKEEIDKEKTVIIEEINSYKDSPSELIFDEFDEMLFDGHPLGRNILGTKKSVENVTQAKIFDFIKRNYTTNRIVLSMVGKTPFDEFKQLCVQHFGNIKQSESKRLISTVDSKSFKKIKRKSTYQAHTVLGIPAYPINHPKRLGLVMLCNLLGGSSMNSRLNMSIREKHGLVYSIESSYSAFRDAGLFNIYFGCDKGNSKKVIELINDEFKILRDKPLNNDELKALKKQFIGQIAVSNEDYADLMLMLAKSILVFDKVDSYEQIVDKVEKISAEDLQNIVCELLDTERFSVLNYK
ncbi:MAG: M16 family metallopeptidase [Bacteroidales bacterium]